MSNTYYGLLEMKEDAYEYELHTDDGIVNISNILKSIYMNDINPVHIQISDDRRSLFYGKGRSLYMKNDLDLWCLHVGMHNLDDVLFGATGKNIEFSVVAEGLEDTEVVTDVTHLQKVF